MGREPDKTINIPWLADQTFQKLRTDSAFLIITKRVIADLKRMVTPIKRAIYVQKTVDKQIAILMNDPIISKHTACKEGCTSCCHTQVSITKDEAKLLINKGKHILKDEKNLRLLELQQRSKNSSEDWYKIPHSNRKCVFLDNNNSCQIYQYRPVVCRTNYVVGSPDQCSTEDGLEKPVRSLHTHRADMTVVGAFVYSKENGTLPYMIWKELTSGKKLILRNENPRTN